MTIRLRAFVLMHLFLLLFSGAVFAQDETAEKKSSEWIGTWNVTADSQEGEKKSVWTFAQPEDAMTGKLFSKDTEETVELQDIKVEGNKLTARAMVSAYGLDLRVMFSVEMDGDKLKGSWDTFDESDSNLASGELVGEKATSEWVQLFNGKDLEGWTAKIRGHELGDNYADTFRVEDGMLTVSYADYKPEDSLSMNGENKPNWEKFGHLFYKDSFSHYILRAEYRFVGEQVLNGPGWAFRNNGFMIHGQDPATMDVGQKFPVSIEVQLLGGGGVGDRPTINLCTPGTNVVMKGDLFKPHCTKSTSPTFHGDQWVTVEVEVRGNKVIRHKIDGETYLEYNQPQYDERDGDAKKLIKDGELMLDRGTISIQSESHGTQFRKIEVKVLDGE